MRRAFTLVEIVIVAAVLLVLTAFLWPAFVNVRESGHRTTCQTNLRQIGLSFMQYVRDYDQKYPPARVTATVGWSDVLLPYLRAPRLFPCPSSRVAPVRLASDYFYNRRFARVSVVRIRTPNLVILAGDGPPSAPTWSSWAALPANAATSANSPALRHLGNANYMFSDGHVSNLKPTQIVPLPNSPSFVIR